MTDIIPNLFSVINILHLNMNHSTSIFPGRLALSRKATRTCMFIFFCFSVWFTTLKMHFHFFFFFKFIFILLVRGRRKPKNKTEHSGCNFSIGSVLSFRQGLKIALRVGLTPGTFCLTRTRYAISPPSAYPRPRPEV